MWRVQTKGHQDCLMWYVKGTLGFGDYTYVLFLLFVAVAPRNLNLPAANEVVKFTDDAKFFKIIQQQLRPDGMLCIFSAYSKPVREPHTQWSVLLGFLEWHSISFKQKFFLFVFLLCPIRRPRLMAVKNNVDESMPFKRLKISIKPRIRPRRKRKKSGEWQCNNQILKINWKKCYKGFWGPILRHTEACKVD